MNLSEGRGGGNSLLNDFQYVTFGSLSGQWEKETKLSSPWRRGYIPTGKLVGKRTGKQPRVNAILLILNRHIPDAYLRTRKVTLNFRINLCMWEGFHFCGNLLPGFDHFRKVFVIELFFSSSVKNKLRPNRTRHSKLPVETEVPSNAVNFWYFVRDFQNHTSH